AGCGPAAGGAGGSVESAQPGGALGAAGGTAGASAPVAQLASPGASAHDPACRVRPSPRLPRGGRAVGSLRVLAPHRTGRRAPVAARPLRPERGRAMTTLGQAALAYAAHGWLVFPLRPRSKEPLTEHGFKNATADAT